MTFTRVANPRDYVPAFKSSAVRSSNRNKRRAGMTTTYKHQNSTVSASTSETNGKSIPTSTAQRNRLRGRTGNSPSTGAPSNQGSRTHTSETAESDVATLDGTKTSLETLGNETEHGNALVSDEEAVLDAKAPHGKHGSCSSSSECQSECLPDGDKNEESANLEHSKLSAIPSTQCDNSCASSATDKSNLIVSERTNCEDEELRNSFPIICPIEGCQKRFTNMTALRFHLNHTRHESPSSGSQTRAKPVSGPDGHCATSTQDCMANGALESSTPPDIFHSCSDSIVLPVSPSRPRSTECLEHGKPDGYPTHQSKNASDLNKGLQSCGSDANDLLSSTYASTPESQRTCNKWPCSTIVTSGVSNEALGVPLTTRTVTAHTVSIPYGLTDISDGNGEYNGSRTTLANHTSTNRHRCSSGVRSDSSRSRGPSTSKSSHKTEPRRGTDLPMDYYNSPAFLARSTPTTVPTFVVSRTETTPTDFTNFTTTIPQGTLGLPVQSTNQLFPLVAGVWNVPNPTLADNSTRPTGVYDDGGVPTLPDGSYTNNVFASTLARPSVCGLPQTTISLSASHLPSSSGCYNPISDPSHPMPSSQNPNRPVSHNLIDPASFYGLPEFLVAAAINALNPNGLSNPLDNTAQLSYTPTTGNIGLSRPVHFTQTDLASAQPVKPPNPGMVHGTVPHMPSMASIFPGSLVPTSFAHGGLPSLAPSSLTGAIPPVQSDRFDPFKLSAAYLIQQAVAGSQLPSIFGQP